MTTEEILDCRSLRIVIGGLSIAVAAGILVGLAAERAIWKKPDCDHPVIPVWVAYVPKNDMVQVRSNVRRILQEMYDTPLGGQATNSP